MQQYSETMYVELSSRTNGSIYIVGDFEPAEYVHYYYCLSTFEAMRFLGTTRNTLEKLKILRRTLIFLQRQRRL
jgi:hypothetical protein